MAFDSSLLEEEESGFDPTLLEEEPEPLTKLEQASVDLTELGKVLQDRQQEQGATIGPSERSPLQRLRTSALGRAIAGPTREERAAMVAQQPSVTDIAKTMLRFTTAPPQLTEPIAEATEPLISELPPVAAGITRGVRDVAVGALGSLPAGMLMPARMVAAPFAADYASTIPEQFQAIRESETPEQAAQALATTGLGGALVGAGTIQAFQPPRIAPGAISINQAPAPAGYNILNYGPERSIGLGAPEIRVSPEIARLPPSGLGMVREAQPVAEALPADILANEGMVKALEDEAIAKEIRSRIPAAEGPEASIGLGTPEIRVSPEIARLPPSGLSMAQEQTRAAPQEGGISSTPEMLELLPKTTETPLAINELIRSPIERGEALRQAEELGQQIRRREDFEKARSQQVSEAQTQAEGTALHPDKPLTDNQINLIHDSLKRAVLENQIPGERRGIISGSPLEAWADRVINTDFRGRTSLNPIDILGQQIPAWAIKGAAVLERGIGTFTAWSKEMVSQFGDGIKPHLKNIYAQSLYLKGEEKRASQVRQAAEVHGPVRTLPQEAPQEVPAQVSSEGVSASQGPAVQSEVLLTPEAAPPISGIFSAKGATDVLYDKIFTALEQGEAKVSGITDPLIPKAKPFFDAGLIKSGADLKALVQSGKIDRPPTPVSTDPTPSGQAKPASKWTAATSEDWQALSAPGGELGAFIPNPITTIKAAAAMARIAGRAAAPHIQRAGRAITDIAKEATSTPKMTDYRRSVLNWSSKLQRSFGEAADAQSEIMSKIPDSVRREGITNWIQADGDPAVLTQRAAASSNPKLRAGYEAALALTPPETALAIEIKAAFDALGQRGQAHDVVNNFKDNYVTQIWDIGKGQSGSRTLKDKFRYNKARTFDSYFDGEQAGFSPKTKDIAKILPVYLHEMNSVIAARQLVQQMSQGKASDGRPLVAPRGTGTPVAGGGSQATLVMPKAVKGDTGDYRVLSNQPALSDWRWASKDSAGNPVFQKSDLALHPEAFDRLKSVLGKSAIRDWYETKTSAVAQIPKVIAKGLDMAQSETKRTMLGLFAPFHQVQEGTHAIGHRINPLKVPKVDLVNDANQLDATKHGLMMLPDRASESQFMEGFRTSGIVSRIPGIGPLADTYSRYLFHDYIPGLKYKTYEAILERNNKVYEKDLAAGKVKSEDIKVLSAEQANAAYGHLNYADLGRNPTIQHLLQLGLLAPDFLEARGRFLFQAVKGATGAKVGREQMIALGFLAAAQATTSWTAAQLTGGEWDARHPFEFHVGSRKYTMRSVPEDVDALISNTRSFVHSRLSPLIGKGVVQYGTGRDYRGQKVSAAQTTKELATAPIPLTLRAAPGLRHLTGSDRPGAVSPLEQLGGSIGLKISRYYPGDKIRELHSDWMKNNKDEKVKADYERNQAATYPVSRYKELLSALADKNQKAAVEAIKALRADGVKRSDIYKRFSPYTASGEAMKPLFHESATLESKFKKSLTPEQKKLYDEARAGRKEQWKLFLKAYREDK